jgi:hypothetical protein
METETGTVDLSRSDIMQTTARQRLVEKLAWLVSDHHFSARRSGATTDMDAWAMVQTSLGHAAAVECYGVDEWGDADVSDRTLRAVCRDADTLR